MLTKLVNSRDFKIALMVSFVSVLPFLTLFSGFFQQDEWLGYTRSILLRGSGPAELLTYAFAPSAGHYFPFTLLLVYLIYSLFGLNYLFYVILSLVMHFTNVVLVYFLAISLFKDRKSAFLVALLFGISASAYQGTAWIAANIGSHMAAIFGILSMIFILKNKITLTLLALLISLLFKEIAVGLIIILPLLIFLYKGKGKYSVLILLFGGLYSIFRIFIFMAAQSGAATSAIGSSEAVDITRFVYNFATLPIKAVVQILIPSNYLREVAFFLSNLFRDEITGGLGSPRFEQFAIKRVFELLNIILFGALILFAVKWLAKANLKLFQIKNVFFGVFFILLNSLVFALVPEVSGIVSIIDSRNFYFLSIGMAFFLVSFTLLYKARGQAVLLFFIALNFFSLWKNLETFNIKGSERKQILLTIKQAYPDLPDKALFYFESDTAYYGLAEEIKIPPFQSGFGQTLLAYYWEQEQYPKEFYENRFLWDITSQGYKKAGERGFGYFRDFETLKNFVLENNIPFDSIFAFSWSDKDKKVLNISQEVRGRLTKI